MVLIDNFEMPKDCYECPYEYGAYAICACVADEQFPELKKRHPDCPLREDGCDICEYKHRCTRRPAGNAIVLNCFKFKKEEK